MVEVIQKIFSEFETITYFSIIVTAFISTLITLLIRDFFPEYIKKEKREAELKIKYFYSYAYAFVEIRTDFSMKDKDDVVHDKYNCGFFHNFNIDPNNTKIEAFWEDELFNKFTKNMNYINEALSNLLIKYMKRRSAESIQFQIGCDDQELIRLRSEIENRIILEYKYYLKISKMNSLFSKVLHKRLYKKMVEIH